MQMRNRKQPHFIKYSILLLSLSIMALCGFGRVNDDNAFMRNSYDKKIIKENRIDTICIAIDFSGEKTERFYAFDTSQ
jgi:hypothetical protein